MGIWYAYENISKSGIKPYNGECTPYSDLKGVPWFDKLTEDIPAIQAVAIAVLGRGDVTTKEYYNTSLVENGRWESMAFLVWNMRRKLLKTAGKELYSYFKDIPGLVSLSISVLKPGTHIKPHAGDTDATYRIHIPVIIPAGLPKCGIKVNGITKPWAEDKIITFCDAYMHEAWNMTNKTRVILIADVVRAEYLMQTRSICAGVLSWLLVQKILQLPVINIFPMMLKVLTGYAVMIGAKPILRLLQRSKK